MKGLYINLARRTDRNERFLRTNPFLEGFQRFEAVDGTSLRQQALLDAKLIQEPLKTYTPGALGIALSHKRAWDMCISDGQPVTVAEDDAVFNKSFHEKSRDIMMMLKSDWDIVLWGWNFSSILCVQVLEGLRESVMNFESTPLKQDIAIFQATQNNSIPLRLLGAFGLVCYSISSKGAERLTAWCFPLRNEVVTIPGIGRNLTNYGLDVVMNKYFWQLNAYVCFPPLVWTENDQADSDVQTQ
jgi:GR25 family glycosyltransferase involved in LPS biosynthesis